MILPFHVGPSRGYPLAVLVVRNLKRACHEHAFDGQSEPPPAPLTDERQALALRLDWPGVAERRTTTPSGEAVLGGHPRHGLV